MTINTSSTHWMEGAIPHWLAERFGGTPFSVADDLAYIAGDYLDMTDRDVLETYINENTQGAAA